MSELLAPFYPQIQLASSQNLLGRLSDYLDLLMKWNARTNLSAIREPEQIVARHFGESLFTAAHLPPCVTLLDLGSGAGFPGLPIALASSGIHVTLAESQNKKVAFLREAVRVLAVDAEIWPARVEIMPTDRVFDVVTLRAVDRPDAALLLARARLAEDGLMVRLGSTTESSAVESGARGGEQFEIPGSTNRVVWVGP